MWELARWLRHVDSRSDHHRSAQKCRKLYQFAAQRICETVIEEIDAAAAAECVLVSRIGHPIDDPQVVDVRLELTNGAPVERYFGQVQAIAQCELAGLLFAWRELMAIQVPFAAPNATTVR